MPEPTPVGAISLPKIGAALADAEHLAHLVGIMAGRLAQILSETPVAREDPVAAGIIFLRSMATRAETGTPASASEPHPIERLGSAYALARVEVDLMVLAGMSEEHEGF